MGNGIGIAAGVGVGVSKDYDQAPTSLQHVNARDLKGAQSNGKLAGITEGMVCFGSAFALLGGTINLLDSHFHPKSGIVKGLGWGVGMIAAVAGVVALTAATKYFLDKDVNAYHKHIAEPTRDYVENVSKGAGLEQDEYASFAATINAGIDNHVEAAQVTTAWRAATDAVDSFPVRGDISTNTVLKDSIDLARRDLAIHMLASPESKRSQLADNMVELSSVGKQRKDFTVTMAEKMVTKLPDSTNLSKVYYDAEKTLDAGTGWTGTHAKAQTVVDKVLSGS